MISHPTATEFGTISNCRTTHSAALRDRQFVLSQRGGSRSFGITMNGLANSVCTCMLGVCIKSCAVQTASSQRPSLLAIDQQMQCTDLLDDVPEGAIRDRNVR